MKEKQLTKQEPGSITVTRQSGACLDLLPVCRTEPGTITNESKRHLFPLFRAGVGAKNQKEIDEEHGDQNKNNEEPGQESSW
jgi:hypothetical protein